MLRKIILPVFMLLSTTVFAQNFDSLLIEKKVYCHEVINKSRFYFMQYYKANELNKAQKLLEYWGDKCEENRDVLKAELLLAIKKEELSKHRLYNHTEELFEMNRYYFNCRTGSYEYLFTKPDTVFNQFIIDEMNVLRNQVYPKSLDYLVTLYYGNRIDEFYQALDSENFSYLPVAKNRQTQIKQMENIASFHYAFLAGAWIPNGNLDIMGTHPQVGFQIGGKKKKYSFNMILSVAFLNAKESYLARINEDNNNLEKTDHFTHAHIGLDAGYEIMKKENHELQAIGGLAYNTITLKERDEKRDIDAVNAGSYNFNMGLEYRYYFHHKSPSYRRYYYGSRISYLGISGKYNIVDYTLNQNLPYSGNTITINLKIGFLSRGL